MDWFTGRHWFGGRRRAVAEFLLVDVLDDGVIVDKVGRSKEDLVVEAGMFGRLGQDGDSTGGADLDGALGSKRDQGEVLIRHPF